MGLGEAALFVGAATLIADLSPPNRRAEAASYFSVAVYGGIGLGPTIGEWVLADDRYTLTFVVAAGSRRWPRSRCSVCRGGSIGLVAGGERRASAVVPPRRALAGGRPRVRDRRASRSIRRSCPSTRGPSDWSGAAGLFLVYSAVSLCSASVAATLPERLGEQLMVTVALSSLAGRADADRPSSREPWALWVGAGVDRRRHGVHVSVADGERREPGPGVGAGECAQLVHDVLRDRHDRRRGRRSERSASCSRSRPASSAGRSWRCSGSSRCGGSSARRRPVGRRPTRPSPAPDGATPHPPAGAPAPAHPFRVLFRFPPTPGAGTG